MACFWIRCQTSCCGQVIENLHTALLQSTSAALWGLARSREFLWRPSPLGILAPRVGPLFLPLWRHSTWRDCLYESRLETALASPPYIACSSPISTSGAISLSQANVNIQQSTHTRHVWDEPLLVRVVWNICILFVLWEFRIDCYISLSQLAHFLTYSFTD